MHSFGKNCLYMVYFSLREVFRPKTPHGNIIYYITMLQSTCPLQQGLKESHFCYHMISFHSIGCNQEKTKDKHISIQHHVQAFWLMTKNGIFQRPSTTIHNWKFPNIDLSLWNKTLPAHDFMRHKYTTHFWVFVLALIHNRLK